MTTDTWWPELAALLCNVVCTMAIAVVLRVYEGHEVPRLPRGISLNTVVSLLASLSRSSLMLLVASSLSQVKWFWFQREPRRLTDLQTLDDASRGPLGAVAMLSHLHLLSVASIGAVITLMALVLESSVQQLLHYEEIQIATLSPEATTRQSISFNTSSWPNVDYKWVAAINAGIWSSSFNRNPSCASGNCTWPRFHSIDWCSRCDDVTSTLDIGDGCSILINDTAPVNTIVNTTCNISLPKGAPYVMDLSKTYNPNFTVTPSLQLSPWVVSYSVGMSWQLDSTIPGTKNFSAENIYLNVSRPAIALAYAEGELAYDDLSKKGYFRVTEATECIMNPCVREIEVTVRKGQVVAETISTDYGSWHSHSNNGDWNCWKPYHKYDDILPPGSELMWDSGSVCFTYNGEWGITPRLEGTRNVTSFLANVRDQEGTMLGFVPLFSSNNEQLDVIQANGLDKVVDNISASVSQYLRLVSNATVQGHVWVSQTTVKVQWPWILFPVVLSLAGALFLLILVVQTQKSGTPLWKTSLLPFFYRDVQADEEFVRLRTVSEMLSKARTTSLRIATPLLGESG
ncbi:uncharacterized protein Z518_00300 [Rhinocladiella mackenziei CBS 650.93]|uniref:Uncharacterized protein n=1 Tax=Rhinocladiella mackenziei CBS 650.93 TaxID=1442369 RepID=A0A0D2J0M2_9EURO|nr:uncharacterized protein Z518_00300 [Rhinocladiella mackenziei CBS 650.93]KIX09221.1 hypothetical protein Z518_00300 [Rhinocladiella mackenziei CBS 650.93]